MKLLAKLVENAISRSPPGAHIDSRARRRGQPARAVGNDDEPGITEEVRRKVFRRFDRPDVSRSTPGNGLGLALGAAVGELHGANSRLSDNRPHGLRVVMTFGEMKRGTATTSEFAGEAYCAGNG